MPADTLTDRFSSLRALEHVKSIAHVAHPSGSPEILQARQMIINKLSALGIAAEVQMNGAIGNIIARIEGVKGARAILLVAHYDTVPGSPGAGDNSSSVAILLETARAVLSGPRLRNDLILLFSDGEEIGLKGAKLFLYNSPLAKNVFLVMNFDARGNSGPSVMFETGHNSRWVMREFSEAVARPVASSVMSDIYRLLPHNSDFTIFRDAKYAGFNFAIVDGAEYYHTPLDNIDNINPDSIQHQGEYALSLTRRYGNADPESGVGEKVIYFNLVGPALVIYPQRWVAQLTTSVALLYLGIVALGVWKKRLSPAGMAIGFLALFVCMIAGAVAALAFRTAADFILRRLMSAEDKTILAGHYEFVLLVVLVTIGTAVYFIRLGTTTNTLDLAAGSLGWWLILMIASSVGMPRGSYLFTWPLLFSLAGIAALIILEQRKLSSLGPCLLLLISATPGVIIMAQMIYLLFIGFNWAYVAAPIAILILLLGALVPQIHMLADVKESPA